MCEEFVYGEFSVLILLISSFSSFCILISILLLGDTDTLRASAAIPAEQAPRHPQELRAPGPGAPRLALRRLGREGLVRGTQPSHAAVRATKNDANVNKYTHNGEQGRAGSTGRALARVLARVLLGDAG